MRLKPEEIVRQNYIAKLISQGFSQNLIVIEKKLSELPHLTLSRGALPNRRVDILCYAKDRAGLVPHLLIECKAVPLKASMKRQLMGYNYYIRAPFLILVSHEEELFGSYQESINDYVWEDRSLHLL